MQLLIVVARLGLAAVGAVATYVLIYGGSAWLAEHLGYDTTAGRAFAFVNGTLNPHAFAIVAIPLIAVMLFWLLTKLTFRQ